MKSIWHRRHEIDRARQQRNKELMQEYDETVYYPQLQALQQECVQGPGHQPGTFHSNGLGWSWTYCNQCGARYNIQGPE